MHNLRGKIDFKLKYKWCCQCGEVNEGIDEYVKHIEYHDSAQKELEKTTNQAINENPELFDGLGGKK